MLLSVKETIFALASAPGKAGVSVFRISGKDAYKTINLMTSLKSIIPKSLTLSSIFVPSQSNDLIDKGMVVFFQQPHSFTGEDVVEIHTHGGIAVQQKIIQSLSTIPGFRLAERGEFARRSFLNNKFDLTEAEGLADLINAETEMQRRQAIYQLTGSLSELYEKWRKRSLESLANMEAFLDFGEDENIESNVVTLSKKSVALISNEIRQHLCDRNRGEIIRNGIQVGIIGAPNAGKSSLMNCIAGRSVAIVSPIGGTTRDVIQTSVDINGYPVMFCDTAGIRSDSNDLIEQEGIKRAHSILATSNCIFYLIDATTMIGSSVDEILFENQNLISKLSMMKEEDCKIFLLINKMDLLNEDERVDMLSKASKITKQFTNQQIFLLQISCIDQTGFIQLISKLENYLEETYHVNSSFSREVFLTNARHRQHLEDSVKYFDAFLQSNSQQHDLVFMTEYLRLGIQSIGKITGKVDVESMLDIIFSKFCIGK